MTATLDDTTSLAIDHVSLSTSLAPVDMSTRNTTASDVIPNATHQADTDDVLVVVALASSAPITAMITAEHNTR
jgi:hypothetical protein